MLIPQHDKQPPYFKEDDINEYLKKHFHTANREYPSVDYSHVGEKFWCNRRHAAKIMQRDERTIFNYTSKGILTYTNYSHQTPRYYIPELKYLSSLEKYVFSKIIAQG